MRIQLLGKVSPKTPNRGLFVKDLGKITVYARTGTKWPLWTKVSQTHQIKVEFLANRGIWLHLNNSSRKYPINPKEEVGIIETATAWF